MRELIECEHRDAYAGMVEFKDLLIDVYVCEDCKRVRVEVHKAPKK